MPSTSELLREGSEIWAMRERELVPEIAELTDAELWELRERLYRAGFDTDELGRKVHKAVQAERMSNGYNPMLDTLADAWQLAFHESSYRQMQGC